MKKFPNGPDIGEYQELITAPGEYLVRHGDAMPLREPQHIQINGDINTVATFLSLRYLNSNVGKNGYGRQFVDTSKAVISIDKAAGTIVLKLDPEDHYCAYVGAKLEISPELKGFLINGNSEFTQDKLVELIKFSRRFFENPEQHRVVFNAFQKFEAQVHTELKNEKDSRGNINAQLTKQITSQLPLEFKLHIPIFKGMRREVFEVEICFNVTDRGVSFWLESVALEELIEQRKDEIFDEMTEAWKEFVIVYA